MPSHYFNKARRNVRRTKRGLRRERESGYRAAQGMQDAVFSNLRKGIRQRGVALDANNARILAKMQQQRGMAQKDRRAVGRAEASAGPSIMSGVSEQAFAGARASAAGGVQKTKAGVRAAAFGTQTGKGLIQLAQLQARQAEAGAESDTAMAMAQRTKEDTALVAQMQHQIAMAEAQHQMDLDKMEKQFEMQQRMMDLEAEKAEELLGEQQANMMMGTVNVLTQAAPVMREIINDMGDEAAFDMVLAELRNRGIFTGISPEAPDQPHPAFFNLYNSMNDRGAWGAFDSESGQFTQEPSWFATSSVVDAVRDAYLTTFGHSMDQDQRRVLQGIVQARVNSFYTGEFLGTANPSNRNSFVNRWYGGFLTRRTPSMNVGVGSGPGFGRQPSKGGF